MTIAELRTRFQDPTPAELQLIARYGELPEDGRRARAFDAFAQSGLPHRRLEQWKWSDFRQSIQSIEASSAQSGPRMAPPANAIVLRFDGRSWDVPDGLPDGFRVFEKDTAQALGNAEQLPMAALTASQTGQPKTCDILQIEVSSSQERPVFLDFAGAGREMAFARIAFVVRPVRPAKRGERVTYAFAIWRSSGSHSNYRAGQSR